MSSNNQLVDHAHPSARPLTLARSASRRSRTRRGATMVEMAIVISLFLTLVLGMIDLGYGVFRYHVLSHTARQIARTAIVRGSLADRTSIWGPDPMSMTANENNELTAEVSSNLVGWNLADVQIDVAWIDEGNEAESGDRVRVSLAAPYQPTMTFIFGQPTIMLQSSSTMRIAH